jgi:hypothetical protein
LGCQHDLVDCDDNNDCTNDICSSGECLHIPGSEACDRVIEGLVVFYPFNERQGSVVHDEGSGAAMDLDIEGAVSWLGCEDGVEMLGGRVGTLVAGSKVNAALTTSSSSSFEILFMADNIAQTGPARLVSVGSDTTDQNYLLGQKENDVQVRLLHTGKDSNSNPRLTTTDGFLTTTPTHLVHTYDGTTERLYVNGVQHQVTVAASGDYSNWDLTDRFNIGNEGTGNRPFLGVIYTVAVYDRALDAGEVLQNYTAAMSAPDDCNDDIFCNGEEDCIAGLCVNGSDPCPGQSCDEPTQTCEDCSDHVDCDDDAFCNGIETCVLGVCVPGIPPCNPGEVCDEDGESCCSDGDGDGVCDAADLCPGFDDNANADGDTVPDGCDNCPSVANDDQADCDGIGLGDVCAISSGQSEDADGNGVPDECEQTDFEYDCVIVSEPSTVVQAHDLPPSMTQAAAGGPPIYVEFWATDSGATNSGIISAYTDLQFPDGCVDCGGTVNDPFDLFPDGTCDVSDVVEEFGGSQLSAGVGVAPQWTRIAYASFSPEEVCLDAEFVLLPGLQESSAFGRGVIHTADITYGSCAVEIRPGCCCIYDLDDNCMVAAGDVGLFAPCWQCSDTEACWDQWQCSEKDFDCSGQVAGGDLGWFSTGWLKSCSDIDPEVDHPACQACDGQIVCPANSGECDNVPPGPAPELPLAKLTPRTRDQGRVYISAELFTFSFAPSSGEPTDQTILEGAVVNVHIEAMDLRKGTQGLTSAFVDVSWDPEQFEYVEIVPGPALTLFNDPVVNVGEGHVHRLGGATLEPGWAAGSEGTVGTLRLRALQTIADPVVDMILSPGESVSAWGQGLVPESVVDVTIR